MICKLSNRSQLVPTDLNYQILFSENIAGLIKNDISGVSEMTNVPTCDLMNGAEFSRDTRKWCHS